MSSEIVTPRPSALIESLRSTGYSFPAAVADVVDNSITAGARNISIEAHWDGAFSWIAIRDDGMGMAEPELVEAMRLGGVGPLRTRSPADLGRFGLGLKTASFSQARQLTVASKPKDSDIAIRRWDLDEIGATDEWRLLREAAPGSLERLQIDGRSGTVVLWEDLDRLVGAANASDSHAHERFLEQLAAVKEHLAMVFHRFLGRRALRLRFNGNVVEPWDPFLSDHSATQHLPREPLDGVSVQPFVLPHASRLSSREYEAAGGPSGWYAQQGFYVYRNERLLVAGDWLGLGLRKNQHHKLARIAVDPPNTLDTEWGIDIKKSRARPPQQLRSTLRRIAVATRDIASAVYRHRGKMLARSVGAPELLWVRKVTGGRWSYAINRSHPLVQSALESTSGDRRTLEALVRMLEETVPISTIVVDGSERPDEHAAPYEGALAQDVADVALAVFRSLLKTGSSVPAARARVLAMEPFPMFSDIVSAALDSADTHEDA